MGRGEGDFAPVAITMNVNWAPAAIPISACSNMGQQYRKANTSALLTLAPARVSKLFAVHATMPVEQVSEQARVL